MIFDDEAEEYSAYHQFSFDSPDLRPIPLPMSGYDKNPSLGGIINLESAGAAFPDSNAFGHYYQPIYHGQIESQSVVLDCPPDLESECYSDNELPYPLGYVEQKHAPLGDVPGVRLVSSLPQYMDDSRKRKGSHTPDYVEPQPRKRAAVAHLQLTDTRGELHDLSAQTSPYSSMMPTPGNSISLQGGQVGQDMHSPRFRHSYSTSNASQVSLPAPSPLTPAWSPSFTPVKTEHSPRAPMTPAPRAASTASGYTGNMPKLVRTSTITQQTSPGVANPAMAGLPPHPNFNPYGIYSQSKAVIKLNGDLDEVALEWSTEELEAARKLVVFTRTQVGSMIDADFKVVPQSEWQRNDITVNCIWWAEKNEAYVTSVDTIALLEQLVAVRFTVEEKNRIRRNLEGFHPLTVSKAKPDSEEFFKVIMGFSNPKPRNIEKDVKVFEWKTLSQALSKIIGKYSASYSSTAAPLEPTAAAYPSNEQVMDFPYAQVPHHEMMGARGPNCHIPMVTYEQAIAPIHAPVPVGAHMPNLQIQAHHMAQAYQVMPQSYGYEGLPMATQNMSMTPHAAIVPVRQLPSNWAYDNFNQAQGGAMDAVSSAFSCAQAETADFIPPAYRAHRD